MGTETPQADAADAPPEPVEEVDAQPVPEPESDGTPDEEPVGAALVLPDADRETVFEVLDRHDEAMIVQELQRRALKVMLYSFPLEGQQVVDLSYLGVNEAVRVMNDSGRWKITIDRDSIDIVSVEEDVGNGPEPCWQATIFAVNTRTGYGQFGTYTQPKRMKLTPAKAGQKRERGKYVAEDDTIADGFSRQKALNKAQRNALRIHIPEAIRQTLIAQYQGDPERIRKIEAGAGAASLAELPPPLTDDRAEQQKQEARALFDELHEVDALAVLPGQFHAYLTRAEHSHERLDEFKVFLQEKIDMARAAAEAAKGGDQA